MDLAAVTNGLAANVKVAALETLANDGTKTVPSAITTLNEVAPKIATIAITKINPGNESRTSFAVIRTLSKRPLKYPAHNPINPPTIEANAIARKPT
jgi:hypothetical protein